MSQPRAFNFRFLDIADLIPQMNPGGSGRILKPEFKQMLNKLMFYMEDTEFEKLWKKYDSLFIQLNNFLLNCIVIILMGK